MLKRFRKAKVNGTPRLSPVEKRAQELANDPEQAVKIAREMSHKQVQRALSDSGILLIHGN